MQLTDMRLTELRMKSFLLLIFSLLISFFLSVAKAKANEFSITDSTKKHSLKDTTHIIQFIKNNKVTWVKSAQQDSSYKNFKAHVRQIFMYASTSSLSKEMQAIELKLMQLSDVFIYGGFPSHAVIVLDMAVNKTIGKRLFLPVHSYMSAQDIHILKNPTLDNSPWYVLDFEGTFKTPEWSFQAVELKRFK